ncbi:hypothetical protein D9M69_425360 [compost metagenome]
MCAFGITADRACLGLCLGGTLISRVDPEALFDLDLVGARYRMIVRERQAIKACQFNLHPLQLWVATDQLLDGCAGPGAVEAGCQDRSRPGIRTNAHYRTRAGGDESGQKRRDHFHVGFTRIIS